MTLYIHEINIQRREAASDSFGCHDRLLTEGCADLRRTVTIQESALSYVRLMELPLRTIRIEDNGLLDMTQIFVSKLRAILNRTSTPSLYRGLFWESLLRSLWVDR
jgi:hypothetical protein